MKHLTFGFKNIKPGRLLLIACLLGMAAHSKADVPNFSEEYGSSTPSDYGSYPDKCLRYWLIQNEEYIYDPNKPFLVPEKRFFGFNCIQDLDDSGVPRMYVTPDGKLIADFVGAYLIAPRRKNVNPPYYKDKMSQYYKGEIIIPDKTNYYDRFVLAMDADGFGDELTAIRTPRYAIILMENFKYAVNLKKVQIGACYEVYPYGFKNCKKLETVIFENSPYVYDLAFRDCSNIKTIVVKTTELPALQSDKVFEEAVYSGATLYVIDDLKEHCKQDPVWSKFKNVKAYLDLPSGIVMPQPIWNEEMD